MSHHKQAEAVDTGAQDSLLLICCKHLTFFHMPWVFFRVKNFEQIGVMESIYHALTLIDSYFLHEDRIEVFLHYNISDVICSLRVWIILLKDGGGSHPAWQHER